MPSDAVKCDRWSFAPGTLESGYPLWLGSFGSSRTVPEDSDSDEDPNDVGPAWLVLGDGTEELINGFEWITRAEARRLASESGYRISEDG